MKKLFFCLSLLLLIANRSDCAVTTIDGAITLDFYEDTQFGNNRWILDMKVNDFDGPGGVENITFRVDIFDTWMNYQNIYNPNPTDDYIIWSHITSIYQIGSYYISHIDSKQPIDTNTNFKFYAIPYTVQILNQQYKGKLLYGDYNIALNYKDNLGANHSEAFLLYGPVGFASIPEPMGFSLFLFGILVLYRSIRIKRI